MPHLPNVTLQRLRADRVAIGFGVTQLRSIAAADFARRAGYHWLTMDMEHGTATVEQAAEVCIAAAQCGVTPLARVSQESLDDARRLLDNGAQGVQVARVESASQARRVVEVLRFPPTGGRGWGAGYQGFGSSPTSMGEIEAQTLVTAMIESAEGVDRADEIAATDGIDGLFVGLVDLSVELHVPGQVGHARLMEAVEAVCGACRRRGKAVGIGGANDEAAIARVVRLGARMIAGGSDQSFMMAAAVDRARLIERIATSA